MDELAYRELEAIRGCLEDKNKYKKSELRLKALDIELKCKWLNLQSNDNIDIEEYIHELDNIRKNIK